MENLNALIQLVGSGEFIQMHFYYFLNVYEMFFIIGLLTLSLAFLAMNKMAMTVQFVTFIGLWCHSWMDIMLQLFLVNHNKLTVFSTVVISLFWIIQITSLALVTYELKQKIDRETSK